MCGTGVCVPLSLSFLPPLAPSLSLTPCLPLSLSLSLHPSISTLPYLYRL